VIRPEASNEFPWISIWRLVKPHANYCVDILKARWLRPALLNRADCYVWLYLKNLWQFVFKMYLIIGITDGWQSCEPPPPLPTYCKCKNRAPILVLLYSLGFSRLLFFAIFGVFSSDFGFLYCRSITDFLLFFNYFLSVGQWAPFS